MWLAEYFVTIEWGEVNNMVTNCFCVESVFNMGSFRAVWVAFLGGLQVFLAVLIALLVKYDPAGRNCLTTPSSLPLCLREHILHCASFASRIALLHSEDWCEGIFFHSPFNTP